MSSTIQSSNWSLYPYDPVKPLPILFAVLILLISGAIVYQSLIKYRWKYFSIVVIWASSVWIAGFICRAYSQYHTQNVDIFIAQFVLILVGPPLYAAAVYAVLSRLLHYLPYHAPLHPGRVISTFIFLSAAVESLTASGAANSAGRSPEDLKQARVGYNLVKAGLILQAVVEILFTSMVVTIEQRCRKAGNFPKNVRTVCYTLYITSAMMLVRCIVRAVEGFEASACDPTAPGYNGYCGYISTHEWILWVFEVANITLFLAVFAIFPPGKYLPRSLKVFLDPRDGVTERKGPGFSKVEKRPFILTLIDPFDFIGILTGRGHKVTTFWHEDHPVADEGERIRPHKVGSNV